MPINAASSVAYSSTDLLVQTASWLRTETSTRAENAAQTAQAQPSHRLADESGDGQSWSDGLGSRFAPETANTLLSAQESSAFSSTGAAQHSFYFDPLDTNRDGKVSYLEWQAGQTPSSTTETPTATAAASAASAASTPTATAA
ncbi:hypothetical protein [Oleispirillum naphthae]|uniref:hypothetical protein n=1 Tax=Oleispirillum naphthae TaxID=2838853 RepID=UPI0030822AA9